MGRPVRFLLGAIRRSVLLSLFAGLLLVSNFLLLTADAVYDAAKRGLWGLASVVTDVGAPRTHRGNRETTQSLKAQIEGLETNTQRLEENVRQSRTEIAELGADNEALERRAARLTRERAELDQQVQLARRELTDLGAENAELTADRVRLSRRLADFEATSAKSGTVARRYRSDLSDALDGPLREQVSDINERLARRTSRAISTNMSSMAVEAIPYVGAAAIVGVTFMEVRDACLTLADTREMSLLLSGEPAAEVPACGYSPSEFWDILRGGAEAETCHDLNEMMPAELRLDCLDTLRPGEAGKRTVENGIGFEDISRPGE